MSDMVFQSEVGALNWITWINEQLKNLVAIVKPNNMPSQAVIKKLGFKYADTIMVNH